MRASSAPRVAATVETVSAGRRLTVGGLVIGVLALFWLVVTATPFLFMIFTSLKDAPEYMSSESWALAAALGDRELRAAADQRDVLSLSVQQRAGGRGVDHRDRDRELDVGLCVRADQVPPGETPVRFRGRGAHRAGSRDARADLPDDQADGALRHPRPR
ncbi:MAG: hypothetical protein WDN30_03330 [Pararobbsia sp.]